MTTGKKLYLLRTRLNLSLNQASHLLGISKSTLCRYEKDECRCRNELTWARICRLYQVPKSYFEDRTSQEISGEHFLPVFMREKTLLETYAKADPRDRIRVARILEKYL